MITLPVTLTVQDLADYQTFSFRHFYQEPVGWRRIPYILIWLILCGMLLLIFSTFSPLPGKFDIYSVFYGLSLRVFSTTGVYLQPFCQKQTGYEAAFCSVRTLPPAPGNV